MNKIRFRRFIDRPATLLILDFLVVIPFILFPLFLKLPYRVNIFLTWEGAYRLYIGQLPFVDFGIPLGYGFWLVPAAFFKIFGPAFLSLIKAQAFINVISIVSLRGILYNLKLKPIAITSTLLVFCLTYVIYNFWPWYNHTVIVFELCALYFITSYNSNQGKLKSFILLSLAGLFTFLSFFTKQDVGGICFSLCLLLTAYCSILEKRILPIAVYLISFILVAIIFIYPLVNYDFFYWFNYGQPPHNSRISIHLLLDIIFNESLLEKMYLLLLTGGIILTSKTWSNYFLNKNLFFISLISGSMILQSIVTRVTSPLPTDHMTYFHAFGFIGITIVLPWEKWIYQIRSALLLSVLVLVCYSEGYWKYLSGLIPKTLITHGSNKPSAEWAESELPTMRKILLPKATNEGLKKFMALPFLKTKNLKVLNMTELTSLAYEIGYIPLRGQPLWFHLNIGMFQKEVDEINSLVRKGYYDVILFEDIPSLNNFYPYEVLNELKDGYTHYDSFLAPRKLEDSKIFVYIRQDLASKYNLPIYQPCSHEHLFSETEPTK